MNADKSPFFANLIGFQLLWPAAVVGAARGLPELSWLVLGSMLVVMCVSGRRWKRDLGMVLCGFLACLLLEPVWLGTGVIEYHQWQSVWLAPGWIWALWGGFAVSFFYCLSWLQGRPVVAALFGGIGGAVSVWMGIRVGAAQAPLGQWILIIGYGSLWAITVPLFASLARRLEQAPGEQGQRHYPVSCRRAPRQVRPHCRSSQRIKKGAGENG